MLKELTAVITPTTAVHLVPNTLRTSMNLLFAKMRKGNLMKEITETIVSLPPESSALNRQTNEMFGKFNIINI